MSSVFDRAKAHYGTTENPYDAGYLLPDGSMLDFSEGGGQGRSMDHRNIGWVYPNHGDERDERDEPHNKMRRFVNAGAIRIGQYEIYDRGKRSLGFEIHKRPTSQQLETIRQAVGYWRPLYVIIEIVNAEGVVRKSKELEDRPASRDVVAAVMETTIPARLRAGG